MQSDTPTHPELTPEEKRAIAALKRLAKRWPQSLILFATGGGDLSVRKPPPMLFPGTQYEVDFIQGIRAEGGDGGDEF